MCIKNAEYSSASNVVLSSIPRLSTQRNFALRNVRIGGPLESGKSENAVKKGKPMALKKRGKTWHCHFVVNGQRLRQSLNTKDWREAQAKEKELIAQASEGKVHHEKKNIREVEQ